MVSGQSFIEFDSGSVNIFIIFFCYNLHTSHISLLLYNLYTTSMQLLCNLYTHFLAGASESVIFTKLNKGLTLVPVVLDQKFKIDCSVNNRNVKVSLYRKLPNGKKEIVKVDGKNVKRTGDTFELVIKSYFESRDFYCRGELYGTSYEKEVKVVIIATSMLCL